MAKKELMTRKELDNLINSNLFEKRGHISELTINNISTGFEFVEDEYFGLYRLRIEPVITVNRIYLECSKTFYKKWNLEEGRNRCVYSINENVEGWLHANVSKNELYKMMNDYIHDLAKELDSSIAKQLQDTKNKIIETSKILNNFKL